MFVLKVSNFQSVQDLEIPVKGLTVLTAPSHSGKTSLVRAADTLLTANWYQEAYQRWGTSLTSVSLQYGEDSIEFTRKGSTTTYKINGESIGKLGGKAPHILIELGYGEVQISESSSERVTILPQLQNQFDGLYQDVIRPAAMTQLLGSFTNLAPYQMGQDKAKKQQAELRRDLERTQKDHQRLSAIKETLDAYQPEKTQRLMNLLLTTLIHAEESISLLSKIYQIAFQFRGFSTLKQISPPFGCGYIGYRISKNLLNSSRECSLLARRASSITTRRNLILQRQHSLIASRPSCSKVSSRLIRNITEVLDQNSKLKGLTGLHTTGVLIKRRIPRSLAISRGITLMGNVIPSVDLLRSLLTSISLREPTLTLKQVFNSALNLLPALKNSRVFVASSMGVFRLSETLTSLNSSRDALFQSKLQHQETLTDLAQRRFLLAKSIEEGLCPLCHGHLGTSCGEPKKVKPKKAKPQA